mgnify:CR=1 FL=1
MSNKGDKFTIETLGKYNIISGNSSTYKTYLVKTFMKYKKRVSYVSGKIKDDLGSEIPREKIHVLHNDYEFDQDYHLLFSANHGNLFIIDEQCTILHAPDVGSVFSSSDNYFIIITREVMRWLPVSVDSIYRLESYKSDIINVPMYCKKNIDLVSIGNVEYILTEDSGAGRKFFQNFFPAKTVASGKTIIDGKLIQNDNAQLHKKLEALWGKQRNVLLVFDAAAYGAYYPILLNAIKYFPGQVSIISWDSFECYLLQCPRFGIKLTKKDSKCIRCNRCETISTFIYGLYSEILWSSFAYATELRSYKEVVGWICLILM